MKRLFKKIGKAFNWFLELQVWIACVIISVMLLIICADVIMRYLFNSPLGWTIEISELGLVWIVSFGMAWLLREDGHIKVDIFVTRFSPRIQYLLDFITSALSAIMLIIVTWYGLQRTISIIERGGTEAYSVLYLPAGLFLMPLCIGFFFFAIQFIIRTCNSFRRVIRFRTET